MSQHMIHTGYQETGSTLQLLQLLVCAGYTIVIAVFIEERDIHIDPSEGMIHQVITAGKCVQLRFTMIPLLLHPKLKTRHHYKLV